MKKRWLFITGLFIVQLTNAQIYQFRGPERDGKFPEVNLLKEWPEGGPELLLQAEGIGVGWSSVVSTGERMYASGKIDDMDTSPHPMGIVFDFRKCIHSKIMLGVGFEFRWLLVNFSTRNPVSRHYRFYGCSQK